MKNINVLKLDENDLGNVLKIKKIQTISVNFFQFGYDIVFYIDDEKIKKRYKLPDEISIYYSFEYHKDEEHCEGYVWFGNDEYVTDGNFSGYIFDSDFGNIIENIIFSEKLRNILSAYVTINFYKTIGVDVSIFPDYECEWIDHVRKYLIAKNYDKLVNYDGKEPIDIDYPKHA